MNQAANMVSTMKPRNVEELAIINAALRPAGASYRDDLCKRIQHHSPNPEVDEFLRPTYGVMPFQENLMQFLVRFCGFSGSESDSMRRLISSKDHKKIEEAIPKIVDGYCEHRDLPRAQAEKEAQEYVQVIKDAGSYAFNKSHSLGYSMIGYVFGYMRYYHPEEFICAFLNYAANDDDITNGTKLAVSRGITIEEPKFRFGQAEYSFDKEKHTIYKGMGSIKYLNNRVATQLYNLRNNTYNNFFELLEDITRNTSVNARQLEILIRLDFFREFGNARLLLRYVDVYNMFLSSTKGYIQSIGKEAYKSKILMDIIARNSTETNTRYKIQNMKGIFKEIDELLQSANIEDFSLKDKIIDQQEYIGYVSIKTGKPEDRPKLFVLSMKSLKAKKGKQAGKVWARSFTTHSIGRGKSGEWMILENDYQRNGGFNVNDIIKFNPNEMKKEEFAGRQQFWIKNFEIILE